MNSRAISFTRLVITVPRLIAEAYASALIDLGAGAVEESVPSTSFECDPKTASSRLVLSFPEQEAIEPWQALASTLYRAFAEQLSLPREAFALETERVAEDYHANWLEQLRPQLLTPDILFVPTSSTTGLTAGLRTLLFEPHPSFGDGSHPTTRLAARATQQYCKTHSGTAVLDVGTGNGVLALVAAISGATSVLGLEIDEAALRAAERNATLNQLHSICGFSDRDVSSLEIEFDWVVANLEPRTQLELLPAIAARVRPGGALAISGFLIEQAIDIAAALPQFGFVELPGTDEDGYALLHWERRMDAMAGRGTP